MTTIEAFQNMYLERFPLAKFGETHVVAQCLCGEQEPFLHLSAVQKSKEMLDMHWENCRLWATMYLEQIPPISDMTEFLPHANRWLINKEPDTLYFCNAYHLTKVLYMERESVIIVNDRGKKWLDWNALVEQYAFANRPNE